MSDALVGAELGGCRVERLLGRGGMGAVYAAVHQATNAAVVIKVLAPEIADQPPLRARFQREGLALSKLPPHPHLVRVHAVRVEADPPFLIMELVPGGEVSDLLRGGRPLDPALAASLVRDAGLGLVVIHGAGLVHRDVKPENLLRTPLGRVKVADLGLAKDVFQSGLTAPGQVMGTIAYMAPEQWESAPQDARCDVFALGATLYHLATGALPFPGDDPGEVGERCLSGEYEPPGELVPGFPEELGLIIARALQVLPDQRYPTAAALVEDLDGFLGGRPAAVPALFELGPGARRYPLLPGKRFTLGAGPGACPRIPRPGVGGKHAKLARKGDGFVLSALRGQATQVEGRPVGEEPLLLRHGARLRLGELELVLRDPAAAPQPPPALRDVRRADHPAAAVEALVRLGDDRVVLHLLEELAPDPLRRARAQAALEALGDPAAAAVRARWQDEMARRLATVPARLAAMTGVAQDGPEAWLAWWDVNRVAYPEQAGPARPWTPLRLRALLEGAPAGELVLSPDHGLLGVGRAPENALALAHPGLGAREATLLRLHGRWCVREDESRHGLVLGGRPAVFGFLDPGQTLQLGPAALRLEAAPPTVRAITVADLPGTALAVEAPLFQALADAGSPVATLGLLAAARAAQQPGWIEALLTGLLPEPSARAQGVQALLEVYRAWARQAAALLPRWLGPGDPATWARALAGARLPAQAAPEGWLP